MNKDIPVEKDGQDPRQQNVPQTLSRRGFLAGAAAAAGSLAALGATGCAPGANAASQGDTAPPSAEAGAGTQQNAWDARPAPDRTRRTPLLRLQAHRVAALNPLGHPRRFAL
jgi:hypothetical protein